MTTHSTSGALSPIPVSSDPLTVRIGVTGHRVLPHPERVTAALQKVMTRLDQLFPGEHRYKVLSALAEGADRLVAKFILDWKITGCAVENCQPALDVFLPMPEQIFFNTFTPANKDAAIAAYRDLRAAAQVVTVQPPAPAESTAPQEFFYNDPGHRHEAFLKNGQILADHSQILIAVWNGRPASGKGGTADIVAYARARGYSVIHIHALTGKIIWPHHRDDYLSQVQNLEEYNHEVVDQPSLAKNIAARIAKLEALAQDAGLHKKVVAPLAHGIVPHWEKATRLAARNRSFYLWMGTVGYLLAASAVGVAATLSLIPNDREYLFWVEAAIIVIVGTIGVLLRISGWQRKWIDYRYLAERLRASCFLHVSGLPLAAAESFPDHQLPWLPDGWITIAQKELWKTAQPVPPAHHSFQHEPPHHTRSLGKFLLAGWIVSQQSYYTKSSHENHSKNERNERLLYVLLGATLLIAISHAVGAEAMRGVALLSPIISILAVTLPAFASAIAGITVHWHFHRNYERYSSMSHFIGHVAEQIGAAAGILPNTPNAVPDPDGLRTVIRDADRAMAHEHEGWRTVFGVRLPGPG